MKKLEINPRSITGENLKSLHDNLSDLGDLSGITHDISTDEVITGNQRSTVVDINNCEIVLTEEYNNPDKQGTIAIGFVIWKGGKYNYRRVKWTTSKRKKACIVANVASGKWNFENGLFDEFGGDNLAKWGVPENSFPEIEFKAGQVSEEDQPIIYPEDESEPIGHIRMIQLFLDEETKLKFSEHECFLKEVFKTENISDTVFCALEESYKEHKKTK